MKPKVNVDKLLAKARAKEAEEAAEREAEGRLRAFQEGYCYDSYNELSDDDYDEFF